MSAFICDLRHIKALAIYAAGCPHGPGNPDRRVDPRYLRHQDAQHDVDPYDVPALASYYADVLYQQNVRSVQHRYPDCTWEALPGPNEKPLELAVTAEEVFDAETLPAVVVLKMCNCWEYQSCEAGDLESTLAWEIIGDLRRAAIRELPGYEDAPWEYRGPVLTRPARRARR